MKVSVFPTLLSVILTAALTYLSYHIGREDENCVLLAIGTAITVFSTLALAMSVSFDNERVGMSIKACSILFFIIMFIANLCFAWMGVNAPWYVILQTVLLVIYLFVVWKLSEIKNV